MIINSETESITLQNNQLQVKVNYLGAELCSLINKSTGIEHLWQADPAFWASHAPILFPTVGQSFNDEIHVDGKSYLMKRHGFARHTTFNLTEKTETHAKFAIKFSAETLTVYPYKFGLEVLYNLFDNELRISYKVINHDDKTIYFALGAHPAFNVPFTPEENYDDYYLAFEQKENLIKALLNKQGYFDGRKEPVALSNGKLNLTKELFKEDALVFKQLNSRAVTLKNHHSPNSVTVTFPHFKSLGIWAKYGAPFVCIEPWLGFADDEGFEGDLSEKANIQNVEKGHVYETELFIKVN